MKALQLLFNNFDLLLDQPDGVQQMKQTILQWAVQGKLVRQDPNDEPASELLKRIALEKAELIAQKKIKKQKALPPITEDQVPFEMPERWDWCRFGTLFNRFSTGPFGSMLHKSDYIPNGIPVVNPANIVNGVVAPSSKMMISQETRKRLLKYVLTSGDIIIGRRGDLSKCAIIGEQEQGWLCGTGSFFIQLSKLISKDFFVKVYISPFSQRLLASTSIGETMANLNQKILNSCFFPLPPLAEQHRIVAKVEELHTLCDQLEEEQQQVQTRKQALNAASLHQLSNAEDSEDFQSAWNIVSSRFEQLHDQPESVEPLRQAILQLAVRGKLVKQDPNDEPASELLKRASIEKHRLYSENLIRKQPDIPEIHTEGHMPNGWACGCTAAIGVISPRYTTEDEEQVSFLPMPMIPIDFRDSVKPEMKKWGEIKKGYTHLANGDVAVAKITPCFQNRKSAIMENLPSGLGAGTTELHVVTPIQGIINAKYLLLFYKTPKFINEGIKKFTGTAGQQRVPREYFMFTPLPIPPLAEQHRIVAKTEELMALCDQLEQQLTQSRADGQRLLQSILAEVSL